MWFSPGDAAKHSGLSLDTLRYYEREGLLGPVHRDEGGRRRYSDGDLAWVDVLICLRQSGMGIEELRRFVGVLRGREPVPVEPVDLLLQHRERLLARIDRMRAALSVLDGKIEYYRKAGSADD